MVTVMVLSMSACAAPVAQEAAPAEEEAAFTGKYIVNAQYVMDHMKDENVLIVDARGEDAAKGGTVEGAVAVIWQQFASVSDGAAGRSDVGYYTRHRPTQCCAQRRRHFPG